MKKNPVLKKKISRFILSALASRSATFTFGPKVVYFMQRGRTSASLRKSDFNREVKRLQKRKYVALTKSREGLLLRLTKYGRARLRRIKIEDLRLQRHGAWDGKWRLFIFDIPEKERTHRDLIRMKLKNLGLYNIQRSTFVYPYDCRRELDALSDHYQVTKYCTFAQVDYIDIDRELRRHFKTLLKI